MTHDTLTQPEQRILDRLRNGAENFRYTDEVYNQTTSDKHTAKPKITQDSLAGY